MGAEKPKISIYATVYNNINWIRQSLKSIVENNPYFKNWELVVTDNYSYDGTYEVLEEYQNKWPNIRVYRAHCSRGKGRQIALEYTKGDLVTYVDLDTIYLKKHFELIDKVSKIIKHKEYIYNVAYRKELLDVGGWKDLNVAEDIEFSTRLIYNKFAIKIVPVMLSFNAKVPFKSNKLLGYGYTRESRYEEKRFRRIIRFLKNHRDAFIGNGFSFKDALNLGTSKSILLYLILRPTYIKSLRYFDIENSLYLWLHTDLISPTRFDIERKFWVSSPLFYVTFPTKYKDLIEGILNWYLSNGYTKILFVRRIFHLLTPEAYKFLGDKIILS